MNIALKLALAAAGMAALAAPSLSDSNAPGIPDPLLQPGALCGAASGQPPVLRTLILAQAETKPFQPVPAKPALDQAPALYGDLGVLHLRAGTRMPRAQAYFDQGIRLAFAFNHAEAQRAFREAQRIDPACAMCYWGEALVLGPNINAPMTAEAVPAAMAAIGRAQHLAKSAAPRDRALIEALAQRYSDDPKAERATLDRAYAQAMKDVAARYAPDDTVKVLYAEALMDTQPWDYWQAGGTSPKGSGAEIVAALEEVLERNPLHPGAIHLYIHAIEASNQVDRALPHARRLARLMPGAGHIVHMPAHIYYRLGLYRESLAANKRAIEVDERYFKGSPSDPMYRYAYHPHNIHFLMVSAQLGGDGRTAVDAATRLDAALPVEVVKQFAVIQPVKAAPYFTHLTFSEPETVLALPAPAKDLVLVNAMYHYARAVAHAARKDAASAATEIDAIARLEREADFKPFEGWGVPAKEIVQTARLVATGRLADAGGDLDGAAKAYEDAIFLEDSLAYMEPPFWYYPVRQSLGAVRLRQGRLDDAERAFRESLARVRHNGWALAGLAETYRRKGDETAERATRTALERTWFGNTPIPALERL
jgi:tetratricopeptide (TPR) repeat protein